MSAATHTPGPWQVSRDNDTTLTIVAPWSDKVKPGAEGWGDYRGIHTASITHHSGDGAVPREHAEANARLIAAAPELLEALLNVMAMEGLWSRVGTIPEQARAVIAQATGIAS